MTAMKGITIKLSETTLKRLRQEARATGRSVAELVRERLEADPSRTAGSVHALTPDLAGSLLGTRNAATNQRPRFRRQ
jgi:hypothetical protein